MQSTIRIRKAKKTGRELVVPAKDITCYPSFTCVDSACVSDYLKVYSEIGNKSRKWEQDVVYPSMATDVTHTSIRENPNNYILCFSFLDMKHLLDIKPDGGTYIYSACEAFNEEMEIDFKRIWHWLKSFNIDSCSFSLDEKGDPCFEKRYHASGHATGEDITWVIDQIDPDYIVPIHTEARGWFAKSFENVILVDEGRPQEF